MLAKPKVQNNVSAMTTEHLNREYSQLSKRRAYQYISTVDNVQHGALKTKVNAVQIMDWR
jgi:catabolite regulation protein CreA